MPALTYATASERLGVIDTHGEAQEDVEVLVIDPDGLDARLWTDRTKATAAPNPTVTGPTGELQLYGDKIGVHTLIITVAGVAQAPRSVRFDPDPSDLAYASDLPALTRGDYLGPVASQAAMLALAGQHGDWCKRTDFDPVREYTLVGDDPTVPANWEQSGSNGQVNTVAGRGGDVVLAATDVAGVEQMVNKDLPHGYPGLDASAHISPSALPPLAINDYLGTVASQAAMLALTGQRGDWCQRTDFDPVRVYTLAGDDPTVLANWVQTGSGSQVNTVAGRTGDVVVTTADLGDFHSAVVNTDFDLVRRPINVLQRGVTPSSSQANPAAATAALSALAVEAGTRGLWFPDFGGDRLWLAGPIVVPNAGSRFLGDGDGSLVEQRTPFVPVFDNGGDAAAGFDRCVWEDLHLICTQPRDVTAITTIANGGTLVGPGSKRGTILWAYWAGIWTAAQYCYTARVRVDGFFVGVHYSDWDGSQTSSETNVLKLGNQMDGLEIANCNLGILCRGQEDWDYGYINGTYVHYTNPQSFPGHLTYLSEGNGTSHRNGHLHHCRAMHGRGGRAYSNRGLVGCSVDDLSAYDCTGLLTISAGEGSTWARIVARGDLGADDPSVTGSEDGDGEAGAAVKLQMGRRTRMHELTDVDVHSSSDQLLNLAGDHCVVRGFKGQCDRAIATIPADELINIDGYRNQLIEPSLSFVGSASGVGIVVAGEQATRTDTVSITNGSAVVLDPTIGPKDFGRPLAPGGGIPVGAFVGTLISAVQFTMTSSTEKQIDLPATATNAALALNLNMHPNAGHVVRHPRVKNATQCLVVSPAAVSGELHSIEWNAEDLNPAAGGTGLTVSTGAGGAACVLRPGFFRTLVAQSGGGTITPDAFAQTHLAISVNDLTAFTLANPTNAVIPGQSLTFEILNNNASGDISITFGNAFQFNVPFTTPTAGNSRIFTMVWDGTKWRQVTGESRLLPITNLSAGRTLLTTDLGTHLSFTAAGTGNLTIPAGMNTGAQFEGHQDGTFALTIVAGPGVTFEAPYGVVTPVQGAKFSGLHLGGDKWLIGMDA